MGLSKHIAIASIVAAGAINLADNSTAVAAKMTLEQARLACRNEVPRLIGEDRGNSRGFAHPNNQDARLRPAGSSGIGSP